MEVRTAIIDVVAEAGEVVTLIVPSLLMTKLHSSIIACMMTSFFAPHEAGLSVASHSQSETATQSDSPVAPHFPARYKLIAMASSVNCDL